MGCRDGVVHVRIVGCVMPSSSIKQAGRVARALGVPRLAYALWIGDCMPRIQPHLARTTHSLKFLSRFCNPSACAPLTSLFLVVLLRPSAECPAKPLLPSDEFWLSKENPGRRPQLRGRRREGQRRRPLESACVLCSGDGCDCWVVLIGCSSGGSIFSS